MNDPYEFAEDRCRKCGKLIGAGMRLLHLGICDDCKAKEPNGWILVIDPEGKERCTKCGTPVAHTADWTLWPWPDGAELCSRCNDERHEEEEYP